MAFVSFISKTFTRPWKYQQCLSHRSKVQIFLKLCRYATTNTQISLWSLITVIFFKASKNIQFQTGWRSWYSRAKYSQYKTVCEVLKVDIFIVQHCQYSPASKRKIQCPIFSKKGNDFFSLALQEDLEDILKTRFSISFCHLLPVSTVFMASATRNR